MKLCHLRVRAEEGLAAGRVLVAERIGIPHWGRAVSAPIPSPVQGLRCVRPCLRRGCIGMAQEGYPSVAVCLRPADAVADQPYRARPVRLRKPSQQRSGRHMRLPSTGTSRVQSFWACVSGVAASSMVRRLPRAVSQTETPCRRRSALPPDTLRRSQTPYARSGPDGPGRRAAPRPPPQDR